MKTDGSDGDGSGARERRQRRPKILRRAMKASAALALMLSLGKYFDQVTSALVDRHALR